LPLPRYHLQRLGHILAEARQMGRKWLARWPLASKGTNHRIVVCRYSGGKLIFGGRGFELFQLELHLVEKLRLALAALAIKLASHLFDRELEMGDQCLGLVGGRDKDFTKSPTGNSLQLSLSASAVKVVFSGSLVASGSYKRPFASSRSPSRS